MVRNIVFAVGLIMLLASSVQAVAVDKPGPAYDQFQPVATAEKTDFPQYGGYPVPGYPAPAYPPPDYLPPAYPPPYGQATPTPRNYID